jgi:cytochrome b561
MKQQGVLSYATTSKILHWLIASIVILMLAFSFFLEDVPKSSQALAYMIHKSCGLTVLALMIPRILWLLHRGRPDLPKTVPRWEKLLSLTVQYSFYICLFAMPLSGWIMSCASDHTPQWFGLIALPFPGITPDQELADWMGEAHEAIAWILIGLLFLHVSGALKHHFLDKDQILRRMSFFSH